MVEYVGDDGKWKSFTATQFRDKVIALAKGLIAHGVRLGDCVAIIAHTSWRWTVLDMAFMSIGALTVPVYETNSPAQVRMFFNDSNVRMAFAEEDAQRDKIDVVRDSCTDLKEAAGNPIVRAEVERAVNKANELVSRAESIRKFEIVPDEFTEANGMLTPSLKAKRQVITDHYKALIDNVIYAPKKS